MVVVILRLHDGEPIKITESLATGIPVGVQLAASLHSEVAPFQVLVMPITFCEKIKEMKNIDNK